MRYTIQDGQIIVHSKPNEYSQLRLPEINQKISEYNSQKARNVHACSMLVRDELCCKSNLDANA